MVTPVAVGAVSGVLAGIGAIAAAFNDREGDNRRRRDREAAQFRLQQQHQAERQRQVHTRALQAERVWERNRAREEARFHADRETMQMQFQLQQEQREREWRVQVENERWKREKEREEARRRAEEQRITAREREQRECRKREEERAARLRVEQQNERLRLELEKQRKLKEEADREKYQRYQLSSRMQTRAKMLKKEKNAELKEKIEQLTKRLDSIDIEKEFKPEYHLGHGAFGTVNAWKNKATGVIIAVKETAVIDAFRTKELIRESEALSKFDHENVVKMLGVCADHTKKKVFLFLELMEGGSIGSLARNRPISEHTAKSYTRDILNGLVYIHSQGYIHRDIKGDNVLLDENGTAKLADLGLWKYAKTAYTAYQGEGGGTFPYLSPEVMLHGQLHGKRSDVWAVGATVFEMVTQHPPLYGEANYKIMRSTESLKQRELVKELKCSHSLKDFLLSIFVEKNNRPFPPELRLHKWLAKGPGAN